jgi:hypothetical protein
MSVPLNVWVPSIPTPPSMTAEQRRVHVNTAIQYLHEGKTGQEVYEMLLTRVAGITQQQAFDITNTAVSEYNASFAPAPAAEPTVEPTQPTVGVATEGVPRKTFRQLAEESVARGESRVLPIAVGGKNPTIKWKGTPFDLLPESEWQAVVPDWINEQAASFPDCNCAVIAKPYERLFIDEDDSAAFRRGYEQWSGESFPKTYTTSARTNRYQSHWLQTDATRKMGNVGQQATFSVRQHNLYVLAEGSQHKNGVDIYRCVIDEPVVAMPDKLVEYILFLRKRDKAPSEVAMDAVVLTGTDEQKLQQFLAAIPDESIAYHTHDMTLARIAGKLRQTFKMDEAAMFPVLVEICERCCAGYGTDYKEMCAKIAKSVARYEIKPQGHELILSNAQPVATPMTEHLAVQQAKAEQERQEYDALVDKCEETPEILKTYPIDAWDGTPYLDFAEICRGSGANRNYIPWEYLINGIMTVVGAIAGNRILPAFNQKLQARFITLLLSKKGGIGKNETIDWTKDVFSGNNLVSNNFALTPYRNIGCFVSDFASARGLLQTFMKKPRVLQEYAELSTAVEKFAIQGSGSSFRDLILNLADGQTPNWSIVKDLKLTPEAPKEISNSVIAATTDERWGEMMSKSSWETLIQRMNIIPTHETRTVFKLVAPNLQPIRDAVLPRVALLETYKLLWDYSPDAEALGNQWHANLQERLAQSEEDGQVDMEEAVGRIQVYLMRIIGHLALWHAPLPLNAYQQPSPGALPPTGPLPDKVWSYVVPVDLMRKAIEIAEYQIVAREVYMPSRASNELAGIENLIRKWAFKQKQMGWPEMKRKANIYKHGHWNCHKALTAVEAGGSVTVIVNPDSPKDQRDWVVVWQGTRGTHRKWIEKRGGSRKNSGRKSKNSVMESPAQ